LHKMEKRIFLKKSLGGSERQGRQNGLVKQSCGGGAKAGGLKVKGHHRLSGNQKTGKKKKGRTPQANQNMGWAAKSVGGLGNPGSDEETLGRGEVGVFEKRKGVGGDCKPSLVWGGLTGQ